MDNADKLIKDIYEFIGDPVDYAELVGSPVPSSYGICYVYEEPGDILLAQAAEMLAQQQNKINELLKKVATTVYAEPVRHGKWKFDNHACGYYMSGCVCSLCGYGVMISSANYCPNCGAKMDLEQ